MDKSNPVQSPEAQPLCTRHDGLAVGKSELDNNNSHGAIVSPLPPPSSIESNSTGLGDRKKAASAKTLIGSQQQDAVIRRRSPFYARDTWVQRVWLWEALSITVAVLALSAIVITLALYTDHPLPKWPSEITINTLISVLTAILKASLMLPIAEGISQLRWLWYLKPRPLRQMEQWDLASRGPWGSLLLIIMLKTQDLAVIGAILTIVAMAVDPFTQQIVQYYSCHRIAQGELATVPFSNNYTAGFAGTPTDSTQVVRYITTPVPDPRMHAAIYTGLLDPPASVSSVLDFECRTGNCTFPSTEDRATFLSLALESRCADIRSNISISQGLQNVTRGNATYTESYASLPGYGIEFNRSGWSSGHRDLMQSGYQDSEDWPSSYLNRVSFVMREPYGPSLDDEDWWLSIQAFECEFYPTVNTYGVNVTNGVLLENVLNSQRMDVWPGTLNTHTLLLVNRTIRGGQWHDCTNGSEPSDAHDFPIIGGPSQNGLSIGTSWTLDDLVNGISSDWAQWWPQDCVYSIPFATTSGLSRTIRKLLGNESLYYDHTTERAKGYPWSDDPWSVNLWNEGNATLETVQAAMDGLTRSITARLRHGDGSSDNVGPAVGIVWEDQTCIRVRWAWISLPAGLLVSTIIFLLLTILRTKLKRAQVLKGSILAVLFNGLDLRQDFGPAVSLEEMRAAADKVNVRLAETKNGSRLVGQI